MDYENFCAIVRRSTNKGRIYEDDDGTEFIILEFDDVGFFFDKVTHEFKFYTRCY